VHKKPTKSSSPRLTLFSSSVVRQSIRRFEERSGRNARPAPVDGASLQNNLQHPDFTRRNAIAHEVDKVIAALTGKSFSSVEYLKSLDTFYIAIENAARTLPDFSDKQYFLDTVYEQFFRSYSTRLADTHGSRAL
jgi:hypothetical protein